MSEKKVKNDQAPPLPPPPLPSTGPRPGTSSGTDDAHNTSNLSQTNQVVIKIEPEEDTSSTNQSKPTGKIFSKNVDLEQMKKALQFCHDYQNKTGCSRKNCSYLHTSAEEEKLFKTTGQLPRALTDRQAPVAAVTASTSSASFMSPPPPPPPLPPVPPLPPLPPQPRQLSTVPLVPLQQPTYSTQQSFVSQQSKLTSAPGMAPSFTAINTSRPSLPLPPMFNPTRPPPSIPQQIHNDDTIQNVMNSNTLPKDYNSICTKRKWDSTNDGVSKTAKLPGVSQPSETLCDDCIEREKSTGKLNKQIEQLLCVEADKTLLYKTKLAEYEGMKLFMMNLVGPENHKLLEDYLEDVPEPPSNILSRWLQFQQSTNPRGPIQLPQLMEVLLGPVPSGRNPLEQFEQALDSNRLITLQQLLRQNPPQPAEQGYSQFLRGVMRRCDQVLSEISSRAESALNNQTPLGLNVTNSGSADLSENTIRNNINTDSTRMSFPTPSTSRYNLGNSLANSFPGTSSAVNINPTTSSQSNVMNNNDPIPGPSRISNTRQQNQAYPAGYHPSLPPPPYGYVPNYAQPPGIVPRNPVHYQQLGGMGYQNVGINQQPSTSASSSVPPLFTHNRPAPPSEGTQNAQNYLMQLTQTSAQTNTQYPNQHQQGQGP